jgi:putative ABC transport system permease protein
VAVISEAMSRRFFPDESPIGKRLMLDDGENTWREIVGVVADVKQSSIEAEAGPEIYISNLQDPVVLMTIVARGPSNPNVLTPAIRNEINKLDNSLAPYNIKTTDELLSLSLSKKRFSASLLGLLAALAFGLAAIGIYSVTSYIVNQRTQEIGIRMSLGARPSDVVMLVIKQGMVMVLVGIAIGLVAAFLLTRLLATLLFGITTTDPSTFVLAPLSLILVAMLANCIPALRAIRVDPITALRRE